MGILHPPDVSLLTTVWYTATRGSVYLADYHCAYLWVWMFEKSRRSQQKGCMMLIPAFIHE